jgi:hypothetical protein
MRSTNIKFSPANTKLKKLYKYAQSDLSRWLREKIGRSTPKVYSFDLLSGVDCPFAHECHSRAEVQPNGARKIKDGKHTKFRCFSASQEVLFTDVYWRRRLNSEAIKKHGADEFTMADYIDLMMPKDARVVRIHVAGDFFNVKYFRAWMLVACRRPEVLFYAYTKSLKYWIANRENIPNNLVLTASRGGYTDELIEQHGLRSAKVVFSQQEADDLGLEVDHDDVHAADPARTNQDFALLIHGVQPKGSEAANALKILKKGVA